MKPPSRCAWRTALALSLIAGVTVGCGDSEQANPAPPTGGQPPGPSRSQDTPSTPGWRERTRGNRKQARRNLEDHSALKSLNAYEAIASAETDAAARTAVSNLSALYESLKRTLPVDPGPVTSEQQERIDPWTHAMRAGGETRHDFERSLMVRNRESSKTEVARKFFSKLIQAASSGR